MMPPDVMKLYRLDENIALKIGCELKHNAIIKVFLLKYSGPKILKLVHVLLYDNFVRYFGMMSRKFGIIIYKNLLF